MPRHSPLNPEVREVIEKLVPLFLSLGSVNALHRALTSALSTSGDNAVHPNRLHALLSEDPSRAIHTKTLEAVQSAVTCLGEAKASPAIRVEEYLGPVLIAYERHRYEGAGNEFQLFRRIAEDVRLPPAVVRWLLRGHVAVAHTRKPTTMNDGASSPTPDWSFQDRAYEACVWSLRQGQNKKAALVIPTGAGKTRVAMRVLLRVLADDGRSDSIVLWVTHRNWLKLQAHRELQRAITQGTPDLPDNAVELLAERVRIIQVSQLQDTLDEFKDRVALAVVDEAHHAAAPSYQSIFDVRPLRGLFLTATPNRTDRLPIGIDEIAYTITYRDLFQRGVLVEPSIEPPLTIEGLDWRDQEHLRDLAVYVIDRAEREFVKTLVVASRTEYVECIYEALLNELSDREGHILNVDDIGHVHGAGSSTDARPDEFLDEFSARPRGILVATAQLLGEGFDDPSINSVVVTYPTSSMIQLMQAAGRGLRYAPGKDRAYVVQVKDSDLAYHFEQRWLYQDISDVLHPQLLDYEYSTVEELRSLIEEIIKRYNLNGTTAQKACESVQRLQAGDNFSLLLTGMPYDGPPNDFWAQAEWSAVPVTPTTRDLFVRVFNDFSGRGASVNNPRNFLRNYLAVDPSLGGPWVLFMDMLHAMEYARRETQGEQYEGDQSRGYTPNQGTTWLVYITFTHAAAIPDHLEVFLRDAINREAIVAAYVQEPQRWSLATKIGLPIAGAWAYLLDEGQRHWLEGQREHLIAVLGSLPPLDRFAALVKWRLDLCVVQLPQLMVERFESFLAPTSYQEHICLLNPSGDGVTHKDT